MEECGAVAPDAGRGIGGENEGGGSGVWGLRNV